MSTATRSPSQRYGLVCVLCALPALGGACVDEEPDQQAGDPSQLVPFIDVNPDPNVVEVSLVATTSRAEYVRGVQADVFAYRDGNDPNAKGTIPGPLLDARKGNRVIVHYRSELPVETTVHWHGIRLPNAADGTPSSQLNVPPGGEYTYEFTAVDAGTFWYHPHVAADVLIERGLYGAVRIRGDAEPAVTADRIFVLDDVKLDGDGQLSKDTDSLDIMLGRQGNYLLANGRQRPKVSVKARTRERWRFVNTANGRFFNLKLGDRPFLVIGWDGGLLAEPYQAQTIVIAPGERYEVLVDFTEADANHKLVLQTIHYDRGHEIPDPGPLDLVELQVAFNEDATATPPALPTAWGTWTPLPVTPETHVRKFELEEEARVAIPRFFINGETFPNHTPIVGDPNAVEIWEIHNKSEMDHPFHLHGMFFQVLDVDGAPPVHRGRKDTVNVPREKTLRFVVQYDSPGRWMYHCHILEHAERGMMGELHVGPDDGLPRSTHH
jgi:FtsP/CotA-like multicopper oxidase with cupredoxin domain